MDKFADAFWRRSQSRELSGQWDKQREATRSIDQLHADCRHLEHQVDKLFLVTQALWELLEERQGWIESDFLSKVKEIDLRDGQLDGKLKRIAQDCPHCGHKIGPKNYRCIYCGKELDNADPFIV